MAGQEGRMSNEPKLLLNYPRADYDRRGEVNWSTLKLLAKSPAHYHAALLAPVGEDTDARQRGRAVHCAALEPERYRSEFIEWTGKTRNGEKWDEFQKRHAGKEIITSTMAKAAAGMQRAVRSTPTALQYLSGGQSEVTLIWPFVRPDMGAVKGYTTWCKSRLDFVANAGAIVDLKTTRDASPGGFGREVARYSYHAQAAFYQDAYFAVTGKRLPYIFVVIEAAAPYVGAVYRCTDRAFELGREMYVGLMDRLNVCRSTNHWPGYGEGEMDLELPAWLEPDDDESEDLSDLITPQEAA
jgi:hypothetical protein